MRAMKEMNKPGCRQAREAVETSARRETVGDEVAQHLAECGPCNQYATETFGLVALLGSQPRVEAPADFDFRLRARLARARDEARSAESGLRAFWMRTFSLPQAAATLALVMFAAGAAAIYLRPNTGVQTPESMALASLTPTPAVTPAEMPPPPASLMPPSVAANGSGSIRVGAGSSRNLRSTPVSRGDFIAAVPDPTLAGAQEVLIYQRGATRSVVVPRRGQVIWGAQLIGLQRAAAARPTTPAMIEAF